MDTRLPLSVFILTLFVRFFCSPGFAASVPPVARLKVINETGDTLTAVGMSVTLVNSEGVRHTVTDSAGILRLTPPFPLTVKAEAEGFITAEYTFTGSETEVVLWLKPLDFAVSPQVITAQYVPGSADKSLYKVRVIDSKRIEAQAAVNLADLLSKELNIRLNRDNAIGGTAVSMAGIGGENIKILIDGVPMIGRMDGNLDLTQINLNNIERIEIVEGPLSVMYGTDALAGVINLITKKGSPSKKFQSGVNTYYESVGKYNLDVQTAFRIKTKNTVRFSAGRNFFDGWSPVPMPRTEVWRPKQQYFGNLTYERDFGKWKLNLTSGGLHETIQNKGLPTVTSSRAYAFDEYFYIRRLDQTVLLNGYIQKDRYLDFTFGYNYYDRVKNTYLKDLTTLEQKITPNSEQNDTAVFQRLTARGVYSMNRRTSKFNYQLGYDIFYEFGSGERIASGSQTMGDWALFGSVEYRPIKRLTIRPGFRLAHNTLYSAAPTPAFNIKYDLNEKIALRFSYSRGFRAPSLKELYLDFVDANHNVTGNPNLKAEYSHYGSAGIQFRRVGKKSLLNGEVSAFMNDLRDRIFLTQSAEGGTLGDPNAPLPFTYINLTGFQATGLQINMRYKRDKLSAEAGFALNGNRVTSVNVASPMFFSPELSFNSTYEIPKTKIRAGLFYKFNGRFQSFALAGREELMPFWVGSFHTVDVTFSRNFFKDKITFTCGGRNLLNVINVAAQSGGGAHSAGSSSQAVGIGRAFFAGLRFNF